jgi:hypothetical protein
MSEANPKIIDLIKAKKAGSPPATSLEFFPPRTEEGVKVSAKISRRTKKHISFCCDVENE